MTHKYSPVWRDGGYSTNSHRERIMYVDQSAVADEYSQLAQVRPDRLATLLFHYYFYFFLNNSCVLRHQTVCWTALCAERPL